MFLHSHLLEGFDESYFTAQCMLGNDNIIMSRILVSFIVMILVITSLQRMDDVTALDINVHHETNIKCLRSKTEHLQGERIVLNPGGLTIVLLHSLT